jgi:Zn-dependent oligopeptidase
MFHEFGHALNIALSSTKYQYYSCARASVEISEIPSHFTELYLKDYSFVSQFAFQP